MDILKDPLIWLLFSFIIFSGILWKFGKSALLSMLDARIQSIRDEIKNAENLRIEAQEMLAQYQRKQRDSVHDAEKILATAQKQADEIRKKAEEDLDESIARRERQLKERLERMQQAAKDEMRAYAASLALEATTRIILENLDKKTHEALIDQSIADVGGNLH